MLPSGARSRIKLIDTLDGPLDEAIPPLSVSILLEDDIDVSRGDMICRPHNQPAVAQDIDAMVCWMSDAPLAPGRQLIVKHTTRTAKTVVRELRYRLDVNTLHRDETAETLKLNAHHLLGLATLAQGSFARAVEHLRLVMAEVQVATVRNQVALSLFSDDQSVHSYVDGRRVTDPASWEGVRRIVIGG